MIVVLCLSGCAVSRYQGKELLKESELSMQAGDYRTALAKNMEVYQTYREWLGDKALFQIGLLYACPDNPGADYEKAITSFETLAAEFPDSPFKTPAEVCVSILVNVRELKTRLQSLEETYDDKAQTLVRLEKEVNEKKKRIAQYHRTVSSRKAAMDSLKVQISDLQSRLEQLEAQLSDLKRIDLIMEEKRRTGQ
ncbi:MAG: hypothetical protein C4576_18870 [Desulfobacteraceae bacterium]|nr:MAG: hypothetical protein C4576_18870 [Desulfobacteraceae bacterium]